MIVCDYLMFVLILGSTSATGERRGPVLRPACLCARETWSRVVCPECLDLCQDVELSLRKIFAYDCLRLSLVGSVFKAKAESNSAAGTRAASESGRARL